MRIDERSWHRQWLRFVYGGGYSPPNLCIYFWAMAFSPLVAGISSVLFIIAVLVWLIAVLVWLIAKGLVLLAWPLVRVGRVGGVVLGRPKVSGVFVEYVRARKSKVCPLIEYTGSQKEGRRDVSP